MTVFMAVWLVFLEHFNRLAIRQKWSINSYTDTNASKRFRGKVELKLNFFRSHSRVHTHTHTHNYAIFLMVVCVLFQISVCWMNLKENWS